MKVAVLTVSRREGWEAVALKSLEHQTFQDFQWVVVSEAPVLAAPAEVHLAPTRTRKSNLNASLNYGLKQCLDADYVIFYQDFIELPPDCFEKLLALATPRTFVTTLSINPPGVEDDPRAKIGEHARPCAPGEWEANVAIAPMGVVRYLGGFDEEYDNGWSWDNVNLAWRAAMIGSKFMIDPTNNPRLLPHDRSDIKELNGEFHEQRMRQIELGQAPLRLDYLNG